ncbi:MAG: response regulator transcription factor [Acidimicrobiia bacterium]
MPAVLVIEDDSRIREALADHLAGRGHQVVTVGRAMEGVEQALTGQYDVVLLDLGLPDVDGSSALQMIRAVSDIPVVITTARDQETEIVRLLDAGADDYVVKPFSADQIEARVRAVLRRRHSDGNESEITVGDLMIDADRKEARLGDRELDLTGKEFELLLFLAEREGHFVSKRELLAGVWHQPYGGADKTIDVHLSWLRRKLGETASDPKYIRTKRGVGVRLAPPD